MAKTLFEKEYVITTLKTVSQVEFTDPTDSMLVVVPAPFLGVETLNYSMTSSGEIHAVCGNFNYILTKPVVNREDFMEENLLKMVSTFRLSEDSLSDIRSTFLDFLSYVETQREKQ